MATKDLPPDRIAAMAETLRGVRAQCLQLVSVADTREATRLQAVADGMVTAASALQKVAGAARLDAMAEQIAQLQAQKAALEADL